MKNVDDRESSVDQVKARNIVPAKPLDSQSLKGPKVQLWCSPAQHDPWSGRSLVPFEFEKAQG